MSELYSRICSNVAAGKFRISSHGYDELKEDNLFAKDIVTDLSTAEVLEEYLDYPKGNGRTICSSHSVQT